MLTVGGFIKTCGICKESDYTIKFKGKLAFAGCENTIGKWGYTISTNFKEEVMKEIMDHGPFVCVMYVCVEWFERYAEGVYDEQHCEKREARIVVIIGYGEDRILGLYWIIKYSRGPGWGENGYMRVARGQNTDRIIWQVFHLNDLSSYR